MKNLQPTLAPRAAYATAFDHAAPIVLPGSLRRATTMIGNVLLALAVGLAVPLAILAVGIPLVMLVQALLWIAGRF